MTTSKQRYNRMRQMIIGLDILMSVGIGFAAGASIFVMAAVAVALVAQTFLVLALSMQMISTMADQAMGNLFAQLPVEEDNP